MLSLWAAQVVSSVPMSVFFLQVITRVPRWQGAAPGSSAFEAKQLSLYALVLGSNLCGNITRTGTMGGQLWVRIAAVNGVQLSQLKMMLRGTCIMMPAMLV